MAQQRIARLTSMREVNSDTRLLCFAAEDALGFVGGQYIIVNTGIRIAEGKIAKRAYSLLSSDADQLHFEIAIRRVENGPGSNYMLGLVEGAELAFSGPWGKFLPREQQPSDTPTLIFATDTGITAALGLINSIQFEPYRKQSSTFWLCESDEYFLPASFIQERIPTHCKGVETVRVPAKATDRESWLANHRDALLKQILAEKPTTAFFSGDGFLLSNFRDAMQQAMPHPPEILIETFFHHQAVKTATATV